MIDGYTDLRKIYDITRIEPTTNYQLEIKQKYKPTEIIFEALKFAR